MSNKRGVRGKSKSVSHVIFGDAINPRHETLDLLGIVGKKPCINDVMVSFMSRMDELERKRILSIASKWRNGVGSNWDGMIYDCMGEDDYIDYDSLYDGLGFKLSPKRLKRLNKKLYGSKKGKRSRRYVSDDDVDDFWKNRRTMYSNGEWDDEFEGSCYKSIKYYPDVEDELTYQEFHSIKEFNDFCRENNIFVCSVDSSNLVNMSVVHCCLDPIDLEYGDYAIITDTSYGGLYWTVESDLPEDVKNPSEVTDGVEARTLTD